MRKSRKVISLVLSVIMIMTTFVVAAPMLLANAADITIDGVTQKQVVADRTIYEKYAAEFLGGASEPTDIVIPGLDPEDDYVIQGMSYYPEKDWMLITAYYNAADGETPLSSKVFVIECSSGDFYGMISFYNPNTTTLNTDHGGGIAISEHNLYYACGDTDRKIAYVGLDKIKDLARGEHRTVQLVAEKEFYEVGSVDKKELFSSTVKTAYTAYVCYDQGVLWTGNFYDEGTFGIFAANYNAPANDAYNSMVWGYKLSGSTSEEEWANLTSATGNDRQGNPSYVIGLSNNIKNVQYAVVDNGKLYVSQSYGTGKGTASETAGYDPYSHLTIADIDLSVPGDHTVTFKTDANGTKTTVNDAYHIAWYQTFDFMPMSEGLCVINDYVYMTFESASNKYLKEAGILVGNCKMPVDVVWKMDQYALLKEERPVESQSMYYEKVDELSQIKDGEEYMILFPSAEKDPVTQNPIFYALSSAGGFRDYNLAKRYATESDGYVGAIGHPITEYDIENGRLYLNNAEKDDIVENRWTITGANSPGNLRIRNASTYFANYRNLYFDKDIIAMTNDANPDLAKMGIMEIDNGNFYIHSGDSYLWCNDFSVDGYKDAANNWYSAQASNNIKMYSGLTETKGTFHPDGLGKTNVISQSVGENVYLGQMQIYKRVVDYYSSTIENRVYTDLQADLQADGTYKIVMETYATDPLHYQITETERPTDFIFVMDASASTIKNNDCYNVYTSQGYPDITYNTVGKNEWYICYQGEYCRLARHKYKSIDDKVYNDLNYHCVDFRTSDNRVYHLTPYGIVDTTAQGDGPDGGANICYQTNVGCEQGGGDKSHGTYEVFTRSGAQRLAVMKSSMCKVIDKIAASSADHRMAVVQFGSNANENWLATGMYNTNGTSLIQYTGDGSITTEAYQKAFYSKNNAEAVKGIINGITPINDSNLGDSDTYVSYGFEMANNIIDNSDSKYGTNGTRNVCIIMVTDGVPGHSKDDPAAANDEANAAIAKSYISKQKGAYVYACQLGNNNMDGFNMSNYLEYVSSNYITATSMTDYGSRNSDKINYHIDVDLNMYTTEDLLSKELAAGIVDNSYNAIGILNDNAVLRQQLSDAFIVSDESTVTAEYVPGRFDAIGRLTFDDTTTPASGVDVDDDKIKTDKEIVVTGYDYSNQYIADNHEGKKLRVTITGVLADGNADLINTSINNTIR